MISVDEESGGQCGTVVHTRNGQIAQDLHVCAGLISSQYFSGPPLIFEVSGKLLIVSILSSVKAELFSQL